MNAKRHVSESATSRLSRLLTMVPWLLKRQGVEIAEVAREFGVTPAQVLSLIHISEPTRPY